MIIILLLLVLIAVFLVFTNRQAIMHTAKERVDLMGECVPVLAYHGFTTKEAKEQYFADNKWIDDIGRFEKQMKYLHDNGWRTLTPDEFYQWYEGKLEIPEKTCMITFDDGYYEMYYEVLPILEKYDFNAVVFLVGSYVPEVTDAYNSDQRHMIGWDKVKEVRDTYPEMSFESHSYDLHGHDAEGNEPWVNATAEQLKNDFERNSEYGFRYMAYPYGGYNDTMLKAVKESDIKMAFAFKTPGYATRRSDIYRVPRQKITAETSYDEFIEILEKTI